MIVIVDYGMGNLRSIQSKLRLLNFDSEICGSPADVAKAQKLILPGVGNFAAGMKNLNDAGLIPVLSDLVQRKKIPVLGICLGMQLLGKHSEEGNAQGLGWLDFNVVRFSFDQPPSKQHPQRLRVPHVGWNRLQIKEIECILLKDLPAEKPYYFTHSFHATLNEPAVVSATTWYGHEFPCIVHRDNIFGTQFHPEKSRSYGLKMVDNFLRYA